MDAVGPVGLLVGGIAMVAAGMALFSRSLRRLRRAGAFGGLFWSSFRNFAAYRLRSLRPAGGLLLGLTLVAGGLAALYVGLTSFYASRLGHLSG